MKKKLFFVGIIGLILMISVGCNKYEPNPVIRAWSNNIAVMPALDTTTNIVSFTIDTIKFVSLNGVDCKLDSLSIEYYNGSNHLSNYDYSGFALSPLYIYGKVDTMNVPLDTTYLFNANIPITSLNNYFQANTNVPSVRAQFYFYGSNLGENKFFTYDGFAEGVINPYYQ